MPARSASTAPRSASSCARKWAASVSRLRQAEVFEAADPARTMPKWLVFGAVAAVILLIVIMSWLNRRSLDQTEPPPAARAGRRRPLRPDSPPRRRPVPPVGRRRARSCSTATGPAWIQVTDQGKTLFEGQLASGQTYAVPATAVAPLLKAGQARSAADQGRQRDRAAGRAAGQGGLERQPQAGRFDAQPAQPAATTGNAPRSADADRFHLRFICGKAAAGHIGMTPKRGDFVNSKSLITAVAASAAILFLSASAADAQRPAAHARPAARAARKADAAGPAPGFPEGPAGGHGGVLG